MQREDALKFETGRIKALQEERLHIQKKTFTKWMNSFLVKGKMEVEDLFTDLADGKKLLKLLEVISGEKLGKPNNGRMRVHKIENVNKSLAFLHTKVRLESIGAEDIVDGNPRLILGLIWTIILRFQIQEIEIDVDEENESSEKKSAKDALLLWCQRKTRGYNNVSIQDFTGSWRSGLGFNALIHAHRPDLIEFDKLVPNKHMDNLNNAFDVAERGLGIPRLLDAEDIDTAKPDEKSVLTYVASYYHTFAQMYNKDKSGRRIANIISQIKEADDLKSKYELDGKSLLSWIHSTVEELNSRDFPNNLEGVQKLLLKFQQHITVTKPPKYNEKSEIEANYFIINMRLKELNQKGYVPPEGLLVHDIERGWEGLEKAEYLRELALREEVIRQTNLEQLAIRFEKKSLLREGYLKDMIQVLSDPRYGINLAQVEATLKKHEAISADILAREQRCEQLVTMAEYLVKEGYHDCGRMKERADEIGRTWGELIGLLNGHKGNLEKFSSLMQMIRDIETLTGTIGELEGEFSSGDLGIHLIGVEDLLGKHSLVESQISSMGESIKRIGRAVGGISTTPTAGKEVEMVRGKLEVLNKEYQKLLEACKERRNKLEDSKAYFQFVQDHEEEDAWVNEKSLVLGQGGGGISSCKDLRGAANLITSHKMLLDEIKARRRGEFTKVVERGGELVRVWEKESGGKSGGGGDASNKAMEIKDVKGRIESLEGKWGVLMGLGEERSGMLRVVLEAFQFYSDANEMDSWVTEKRPLVSSSDYGSDEPSAQALLQRHLNLEEEIIAYENDVKGLNSQAGRLGEGGIHSLGEFGGGNAAEQVQQPVQQSNGLSKINQQQQPHHHQNGGNDSGSSDGEFITEQKLVPEEYFEDEVVERTDYATVTEERAVPQVKALYLFQGQEIEIKKGEVMFLLNKTNSDWWNVRKANGEDGFVPANYVKEIEPKVVMVQVRKPEVVKETRRVKKTRMVVQSVQKPKKRQAPRIPSQQQQQQQLPTSQSNTLKKPTNTTPQSSSSIITPSEEPISKRTTRINTDYSEILSLSAIRKKNLQESIKLFQFLRECDDFEKWIGEKKKYLATPESTSNEQNVQVAKRAFEKFLTDLTASNKRVGEIDGMVREFEEDGSNNADVVKKVKARADEVKKSYNELLELKSGKEKTLEGALSVELFNRTCEEVSDWMGEKVMQIDTDQWSNHDLKTVQALQRKHSNLERELAPIQEKVRRVELLAESVKASYPDEEENVEARKVEVVKSWEGLVRRADERKHALENAVGMQIFVQGVKGLQVWGDGVKDLLNSYVPSRDVSSAEEVIKKHGELGDEVKSKSHEFEELRGLGDTILGGGEVENGREVGERLAALQKLEDSIRNEYSEKTDWLNQVLDLQVYLREADHIDSGTRAHLQFVKEGSVGGNLDEVEGLIKRHADFENTLVAMDERLKGFVGMGEKLVQAGHFESGLIRERGEGVVGRKEEVKSLAKTRKEELHRSLKYHEFNNDVEETLSWVNEKIQIAQDESYKSDLSNVDKKLKKHEAFAGELRANEVRIKNINRAGEKLVHVVPEKEREIRDSVDELNRLWEELVRLSSEKLEGLRQAEAQAGFNKALESVLERLSGIERGVANVGQGVGDQQQNKPGDDDNVVNDRRSCKDAVKRAANLGSELGAVKSKVDELEKVVEDMEKEKHFDSPKIRNRVDDAKEKISKMVGPLDALKRGLEEKYSYYSFLHELEVERGWINEKLGFVVQDVQVQDLYQAQTVVKKFKKLEQEVYNREGVVGKLVERGNGIVGELEKKKDRKVSSSADELRSKIAEFKTEWEELKNACKEKSKRLDLSLKSQQFFFDAGEIEAWMIEKEDGLRRVDYGKDIHSAVKLLTKHKTVELEMDSYVGLVAEMRVIGNQMVSSGHPDSVLISAKIQGVEDHMALLRKLGVERREKLIARVHMLEYLAEAEEFRSYVDGVFGREVGCNDYGGDYEHLCLLKGRFGEVEMKVDGVNERFKGLEKSVERLSGGGKRDDGSVVEEVLGVQEELREKWNNMLSLMAAREQKLHAAGEIHAFNRDVADALARIQEKLNSIPETVGRDVNSCEGMLRAHEGFENDLLALEAQLQVLINESTRLQSLYPTNSANIRQEQSLVIDSWNNLQTKATLRKEQLQNAVDFWRFSAEYASLTSFITSLLTTLPSQPKVRDTASSQSLMNEHDRIRGEIDAREDQFDRVFMLGSAMVEEGHPDSPEVNRMISVLKSLKGKLAVAWENKKVYLDQLIDLNIFLRDAKGLETVCTGQEVSLGAIEFGESVEDADKACKRFEAFEKLVHGGEDKFRVLDTQGNKLVRQDHFESQAVKLRLGEVAAARAKVLQLVADKRVSLEERLNYVQFLRDVDETTTWVDEKVKRLKYEGESANSAGLNLQEKIKKLKKFQGFSAEVSSNRARVEELVGIGRTAYKNTRDGQSTAAVENLSSRWMELVALVQEFGKDLEEAHDILEFTVAVEEMEAWVREKESLVHAGDTGKDYEHCCEIIKKLEDVDSGIRVDDSRVKGLNGLADKLVRVTGDSDGVIEGKRRNLNERWGELKGGLEGYRVGLNRALETHKYNRDVEEVEERMNEKVGGLNATVINTSAAAVVEDEQTSTSDLLLARDLEHCESLVRRHDMVEAQVYAIEQKVVELESERSRLVNEGVPPAQLKCLESKWLEVSHACLEKRNALTSSMEVHRFLKKFNEVKSYFESVHRKLSDTVLGSNVEEAEGAQRALSGLHAEVLARDAMYNEVVKVAKRCIVESHVFSREFGERVREIEGIRGGLEGEFKCLEVKLGQSVRMQKLFFRVREVEREIEFSLVTLKTREVGESLSGVGVLLRRHEEFTKEFGGIEGKVSDLITQGTSLASTHYDSQTITLRLTNLKQKLEKLKSRAQTRSAKLHESYELHKFVLEINEIENYAIEKLKIAADDNYSDMSNLQSKIQRHAGFESEVVVGANYQRLVGVVEKAGGLGHHSNKHSKSDEEDAEKSSSDDDTSSALTSFISEIKSRVCDLQEIWKELVNASNLKRERLQESYQALLFNQNLDDIESWMDELESQLESEDHGSDLESVEGLIKKWVHLESEFNHKSDVISGVERSADAFVQAEHYLASEIVERVSVGIRKRYEALSEPLHIRRENLEETRRLYEFLRDVEEEYGWVGERVVGVGVDAELGANLTQVQSLQKKHNQLESEIISHEPLITSLSSRASAMIRSSHYASDQIQSEIQKLTSKFQELKDSAAVRRLRLADSLLSQSFYDEANELLSWMGEKGSYCRGIEVKESTGGDVVGGLLKRLEGFQRDLEAFGGRIERVSGGVGEELVNRGHFDSDNIRAKMEEVAYEYSELQKSVDKKRCRLMDAKRYWEFSRGVGEALDWINEMMNIAGSEEYGRDVEHVEVLIQKFEGFMANVQESRALVVVGLAEELVEEGYPDVERVRGRAEEVKVAWEEFKELSSARLEALMGAKQVHSFDRTADETISWINEKHAVVSSDEYGHDLESIQSLIRRHAVFENDLKPVEAKVTEVRGEADRLRTLFVDASEHIDAKLSAVEEAWAGLVDRSRGRGDRLSQAESLQAYFDKYSELMAYVNEMVVKVTSGGELGRDVRSAEASLNKNELVIKEIEGFRGVGEFCERGEKLIDAGHFMGEEIREKVVVLSGRWEYLKSVAYERNELFKKNLDLRVYLVQVDELDKWLSGKEPELKEVKLGESIREVEELIREHDEFVHGLEAQEGRVEGLKRKTLIEEAWEEMRRREEVAKEVEMKRLERERVEMVKRREVERITKEISKGKKQGVDEKDNAAAPHTVEKNSSRGFLGNTRFGSFVFGGGSGSGGGGDSNRRRGSEPSPQTSFLHSKKSIGGGGGGGGATSPPPIRTSQSPPKLKFNLTSSNNNHSSNRSSPNNSNRSNYNYSSGNDEHTYLSSPSPTNNNLFNNNPNLLFISVTTPPSSLNNSFSSACSQQEQTNQQTGAPLSRSESLRLLNTHSQQQPQSTDQSDTLKKPKRTPSFTTRRRTASFRNKKNKSHPDTLPPVEIESYLERKHELQAGGKRAAVRSWKHYYVLLCGQLICFFKDQEDFELSKVGSSSPINVCGAKCEVAVDYTKRKFVFRVKPADGSEYLFAAESREGMEEWVRKVNFHAGLEPRDQLMSMGGGGEQGGEQQQIGAIDEPQNAFLPPLPPTTTSGNNNSKRSSTTTTSGAGVAATTHYDSTSTDDDDSHHSHHEQHHHHHRQRKPKPRGGGGGSLHSPRSREPIYANNHDGGVSGGVVVVDNDGGGVDDLEERPQPPPPQLRSPSSSGASAAAKPPIPPRSSSIILEPNKSPTHGGGAVDNQQYFASPASPSRGQMPPPQPPSQRPLSVDNGGSGGSSSGQRSLIYQQQQQLLLRASSSSNNNGFGSSSNNRNAMMIPPMMPSHPQYQHPPPAPLPRTIINTTNQQQQQQQQTQSSISTFKPGTVSTMQQQQQFGANNNNNGNSNNRVIVQQQSYYSNTSHQQQNQSFIPSPMMTTMMMNNPQQQQQFHHQSSGSGNNNMITRKSNSFMGGSSSSGSYGATTVTPNPSIIIRGPTNNTPTSSSQQLHPQHQLSPRSTGSLPPGLSMQQQQHSPGGASSSSASYMDSQQQQLHHHNNSSNSESEVHAPGAISPRARQYDTLDGSSSVAMGGSGSSSKSSSSKKKGKEHKDRNSGSSQGGGQKQDGGGDGKEGGSGGLMGLFRRKKATQL